MPSELGKLVRAERKKQRIGLREFATRVGKSPAFIVRLETDDEVPSVTEETLLTIARALGLDGDRMLGLARKLPKALTPDDALDLAVYRKAKGMSAEEKRKFLERTGDETGGK